MAHIGPSVVWGVNGFVAISFIAGITVKLWPILKKLQQFLDDFQGEEPRPGVPERPGVMKRLETLENDVKELKHLTLRKECESIDT